MLNKLFQKEKKKRREKVKRKKVKLQRKINKKSGRFVLMRRKFEVVYGFLRAIEKDKSAKLFVVLEKNICEECQIEN